MSTAKQKHLAFSVTRIIIWILIGFDCDWRLLTMIIATVWLWLPKLIGIELKLIDLILSRYS